MTLLLSLLKLFYDGASTTINRRNFKPSRLISVSFSLVVFLVAFASCQQQQRRPGGQQPPQSSSLDLQWFARMESVSLGDLARNAAFDQQSGKLAVVVDGRKSVLLFETRSPINQSLPIVWPWRDAYPTGSYSLLLNAKFVYFCETDQAASCVKLDIASGSIAPDLSRIRKQPNGREPPSIFTYQSGSKEYLLSFASVNVFSYFESSQMMAMIDKSTLEAQPRTDSYIAGPSFAHNNFAFVVWLRTSPTSPDFEDRNLIKIGRWCTQPRTKFDYYVEAAFSLPQTVGQPQQAPLNVSTTLFDKFMAISSRPNASKLTLCYLSKESIETHIETTIRQCSEGVSNPNPGFAPNDINAVLNCDQPSIRNQVLKGCDHAAFFAAAQSTDCLSAVNFDLPSPVSIFVDSAALVLSPTDSLLFFTDAYGAFVKVHVTVSQTSLESKIAGVHSLSASVGPLQPNEQVLRLFVDETFAQLIFVTSRRVLRIPASNCLQYSSCDTCLSSKDPLCAWCPSTGTCSLKVKSDSVCPDVIDPQRQTAACPALSADDVNLDEKNEVALTLSPWPFYKAVPKYFTCKFEDLGTSIGTVSGSNINCAVPKMSPASSAMTKVSLRLLAQFPDSDRDIEITHMPALALFKCSSLKNCTSCAGGLSDKCLWCFITSQCTSKPASCGNLLVRDQSSCPVLRGIVGDNGVAVPSRSYAFDSGKVADEMRFEIGSGDDIFRQVERDIKCRFAYADKTYAGPFPGRLDSARRQVVCETAGLSAPTDRSLLPGASREFVVNVDVLASDQVIEYNSGSNGAKSIAIEFHSCSPSPLAPRSMNTCGHCRALNSAWKCQWCDSKCISESGNCSSASNSKGVTCKASISSFQPMTGPLQGGTLLNISTVDLDIPSLKLLRVSVAGLNCDVDERLTKLPDTVLCKTANAANGSPSRAGKIHIFKEGGDSLAESAMDFTFVALMPDGKVRVEPVFGPETGGTMINVTGSHFAIGSTRSVWLGRDSCNDAKVVAPNVIQCTTSGSSFLGQVPVHVLIDGYNSTKELESLYRIPLFEYRRDPEPIIKPAHGEWTSVKIAPRGGSQLRVSGLHLNSSASPQMAVRFTEKIVFVSPCQVDSSTSMTCRSPNISSVYNASMKIDYGLRFSKTLEFWSNEYSWLPLVVTPDPQFSKATIDMDAGSLTITGSNLNDSFLIGDYNITLAGRQCLISSLMAHMVICTVSLSAINGSTGAVPVENLPHTDAKIVLGGDSKSVISLRIASVDGPTSPEDVFKHLISTSLPIFIPAAAGLVIVLIVIILVACLCTRKRNNLHKYEKTSNGIVTQQQQLAKYHRNVFTEQTQSGPQEVRWNSDIPFHKYRDYCQNFFFPMVDDFRSMQTPPDVANIGITELERFYRLLLRENFLIAFVNALENPQHFKHTDITRVAALLSVVLQPHMVYHTAIIRRLLDDLIAKTAQRNPTELKQLLRRAEHVVERMLANWLAMLLYDHVLSGPGQALFRLSRASHLKTTSGKVDPVSGKSMYALSERSLLQDPSQPLEITLHIFDNVRSAIQSEEGRRTVTVLDCDTVAQAKAKILDAIYEGVPFSARLTPADCDIQFVQADGKRVDLPDDSQQAKPGNSTLPLANAKNKPTLIRSFNIENNTKVIIIRRPTGTYGTNTTSLKSVVSQQSSTGAGGSDRSGDSHSLLNGSPLLPGSNRPLVATTNGSANNSASAIFYAAEQGGISVSLSGEDQKTPGGTRRAGLLTNNRRRAGSDRGEKRGSRASNASSTAAAVAVESTAPPSEFFLSRLIVTKRSLQEHIDNLFQSLFRLHSPTDPSFPLAIRYLFDLFDDLGKKHGITDPEVLYCWKTNAVPLRFWVNLVQNPDYLLDIEVIEPVKHCLSVVTQALMDSCSRDPQQLSQRSASNKQLFSQDVVRYHDYVQLYYNEIQQVDFSGSPLEFIMNGFLAEQSHLHARSFDPQGALRRLADAALRYSNDIDRQLRSGLNAPVTDGVALADEFAGIVRDLRVAGLGNGTTVSSAAGATSAPGSTTPGSMTLNNGTGISFTATPVGTNGSTVVSATAVPPLRQSRTGSQVAPHQQPQQTVLQQQQQPILNVAAINGSSFAGGVQPQFIMMKHPTHL